MKKKNQLFGLMFGLQVLSRVHTTKSTIATRTKKLWILSRGHRVTSLVYNIHFKVSITAN